MSKPSEIQVIYLFFENEALEQFGETGQAFLNYNFLYTIFRAHKTVLDACLCTWKIMHVTNNNMISGRK